MRGTPLMLQIIVIYFLPFYDLLLLTESLWCYKDTTYYPKASYPKVSYPKVIFAPVNSFYLYLHL